MGEVSIDVKMYISIKKTLHQCCVSLVKFAPALTWSSSAAAAAAELEVEDEEDAAVAAALAAYMLASSCALTMFFL